MKSTYGASYEKRVTPAYQRIAGDNNRTTLPHELDQDNYLESTSRITYGREPYFKTERARKSEDFMAYQSPNTHFLSLNKSDYGG